MHFINEQKLKNIIFCKGEKTKLKIEKYITFLLIIFLKIFSIAKYIHNSKTKLIFNLFINNSANKYAYD